MAKHMVICPHCHEKFDANSEEYVLISRRYWHKHCREEFEANQSKEEKDLELLFKYCSELFGKEFNFPTTKRLIDKYHSEYQYTYSGILRTLKYWYEVKQHDTDKANGTIGIVPHQYQEAYNYYYSIWLANQSNKPKILQNYEPKIVEFVIKEPVSKPQAIKPFPFLDLDEGDSNDK